jgi:hypothetical protein
MAEVAELVRRVLELGDDAGVRFVLARHVPDEVVADLARQTYLHAVAQAEDRGVGGGWLTYADGILPWWRDQAGLSKEESYRLHKFRSDLVDWLEERGAALREDPRSTPLLVQPDVAPPHPAQNPDWTWEEDVLALDLFVTSGALGGGPLPGKTDQSVAVLSQTLRALPIHPDAKRGSDFRNPPGAALKLANFRAVERVVKQERQLPGAEALPSGMPAYSAMDRAVFEHYFDRDFVGLIEDAAAIRATAAAFRSPVDSPVVTDRPVEDAATLAYEVTGTDPGTRTRAEHLLVQRYALWMESRGVAVVSRAYRVPGSARPILCDAFLPERNVLIEAKGSDGRASVRLAIGQLYDYRRFEESKPNLAVLLPYEPSADMQALLKSAAVEWIWPLRRKAGYRDSRGGLYCS